LAYQLKQTGTLENPLRLQRILDVAKRNIAYDKSLDPLSLADKASALISGNINFVTLPIVRFGKDQYGQDVNIVDVPAVQALVRRLIGPNTPATPAPAPKSAAPTAAATHKPASTRPVAPASPDAGLDPLASGGIPCVK